MQYQLTVLEGPDSGKSILLTGKELYIGRDASSSSLVLSDTEASRQHARVSIYDGGVIHIEDLGSSNGTYVNEEKISGPMKIGPGDRVRLGSTVLNLVPAEQTASAAPAVQAGQATASISIGRESSNDLIIDDPKVSRTHARIDFISGTYYLVNLSSTGATYLDGQMVGNPVTLPVSSWVQVQGHNFYFDGNRLLNEKGEVAAVFRSSVLSPDGNISLPEALSAPFKGLAIIWWLLGSILAVIPVVGFLANGYRYRLLKNGQSGAFALPEWESWGDLFVTGLQFFLVRLTYLILPIMFFLLVLLYAPPAPVNYWVEMIYYSRGWLLFASLLLLLLAWCIMPVALAHFASNGSFRESLQLSIILQLIKTNLSQYVSLIVVIAGLWVVVAFLAIIPYIGFLLYIIGAFYIYIVSSLLFGEFYGRSMLQTGSI